MYKFFNKLQLKSIKKSTIVLIVLLLIICSFSGCKKKNSDFSQIPHSSDNVSETDSVAEENVSDTKETISNENSSTDDNSSKNNSSKKEENSSDNTSKYNTNSKKEPTKTNKSSETTNTSKDNSSSKNNTTSKGDTSSKKDTSSQHNHLYLSATCQQPQTCTICGKTLGDVGNHKYEYGTCIHCDKTADGYIKYYEGNKITITKSELDEIFAQKYVKPKNVILMIGDGMGPNDITIAEKFGKDLFDFGFAFNKIPNNGFATTNSLSGTTDSAASATALATGFKTKNGYIGMDKSGNKLTNISEIARQYGKKVGVVTNDSATGATPSAFLAHNISRNNGNEILIDALKFKPDVFCGYKPSITGDAETLLENFITTTVTNTTDGLKLNDLLNNKTYFNQPYIGFSKSTTIDPLCMYTEIALNRLKNDNGFFLMIENTFADKGGHNNDIKLKISSVPILDKAVVTVLKFMKDNPDTLLIVTSDHETGGVKLPADGEEPSNSLFTTTGHTSTDVRVFALGYGTEYFNGKTVDNTDIGNFIINAVKGE